MSDRDYYDRQAREGYRDGEIAALREEVTALRAALAAADTFWRWIDSEYDDSGDDFIERNIAVMDQVDAFYKTYRALAVGSEETR